MAEWHHRLNGHGFGWTTGVGDGQGGLACCGLWGCEESDMTEILNKLICVYVSVSQSVTSDSVFKVNNKVLVNM